MTGIAGFQLANGDYGWIRLRVDDLGLSQPVATATGSNAAQNGQGFADQITLVDWAINDAGTAIAAGTTVPEPSSLALLAAGAAGLARMRRRQSKAAH